MKAMKRKILKGTSASPGIIQAKVYKIKNITKPVEPKPGFIIVTEFTTPVIAPAISQSKGIICTTGGLTSHAAIIAREFNIPCLVGVKGAMKKLKDKQLIILDADKEIIYEA